MIQSDMTSGPASGRFAGRGSHRNCRRRGERPEMDYITAILLTYLILAVVLLCFLLQARFYRTAAVFILTVLACFFFLTQSHPRKVITIEDLPKKQGPARTCGSG